MKKKQTVLELLSEQSRNAVNVVLTTIETLKTTNQAIDNEKEKNDALILSLQSNNSSLLELKNGNEKIISNFENLLK